jgi:hypothetical protein
MHSLGFFAIFGFAMKKSPLETKEEKTLKRLLAMPPQPKTKKDASASPKKLGRPAKAKTSSKHS